MIHRDLFIQSTVHESGQKVSDPPQSRPDYSMTEVFVENFAKVFNSSTHYFLLHPSSKELLSGSGTHGDRDSDDG